MPDWLRTVIQVLAGIPLVAYGAGIVSNLAVGAYKLAQPKTFRSQRPKLDLWASAGASPGLNIRAANILLGLQVIAAWPTAEQIGARVLRRETDVQFRAWAALDLVDRRCALFDALLAIVVAVLAKTGLIGSPFVIALSVILLGGTVCRHASYLLVGIGGRLRMSKWSPQRILALVAISDAVTLLLTVSLILTVHTGGHLDVSRVREAATDLYAFGKFSAFLHEPALNVLVALVGLLFYSVVIKTVLSPKSYSRSDEDYGVVAWNFLCAGEIDEARSWLARQGEPTSTTFTVRAAIELADDDFEQALASAVTAQAARGEDDSADLALLRLWQISLIALSPSEEETIDFIERCLRQRASDAVLCLTTINALLSQLVTIERLSAAVLDRLTESSYPIARAVTLSYSGDWVEARDVLEGASPGSEIEEFLRLLYMTELKLVDPELAAGTEPTYLDGWRERELPALEELAREIPRCWKQTAATALAAFATSVSELAPEVGEAVMALVRRISVDVMSDAQLDRWLVFQHEMLLD